jgi:hypothetical protein
VLLLGLHRRNPDGVRHGGTPPPPPPGYALASQSVGDTGAGPHPPVVRGASAQHRACIRQDKARQATAPSPKQIIPALIILALESESEDKAGPWGQFTPSHLYDFDNLYDPDCASDGDFDNPHGNWPDFGQAGGGGRAPPGVMH